MITEKSWNGLRLVKSNVTGSSNNGGVTFDDSDAFAFQPCLPVGIRVCSGDVIDSIELLYDKELRPRGECVFFHGGPNGYEHIFWLDDGEYISRIDMEYGRYIFSLDSSERDDEVLVRIRLVTSKGRDSGWYGNECGKGEAIKVHSENIQLRSYDGVCCLYGSICKPNMELHNYVRQLGVYWVYCG